MLDEIVQDLNGKKFGTILADPPWQFMNRTGKVAPEHGRLRRYSTLNTDEIASIPVGSLAEDKSHLYLWCPNALLPDGLKVMQAWGFTDKSRLHIPHPLHFRTPFKSLSPNNRPQ